MIKRILLQFIVEQCVAAGAFALVAGVVAIFKTQARTRSDGVRTSRHRRSVPPWGRYCAPIIVLALCLPGTECVGTLIAITFGGAQGATAIKTDGGADDENTIFNGAKHQSASKLHPSVGEAINSPYIPLIAQVSITREATK